jgi:class 3 adenylate cyclase/sensor domain CHASE-containing protein
MGAENNRFFSIQTKTYLLISGISAVMLVSLTLVVQLVIMSSFKKLEIREINRNTSRVNDALKTDLRMMLRMARDYSIWDDTFNFIQNPDQTYIDANIIDTTFTNLDLCQITLMDHFGKIKISKSYQTETGIISSPIYDPSRYSYYYHFKSFDEDTSGYMRYGSDLYMTVSSPIMPSSGEGSPAGGFFIMRKVNDKLVQSISETTHINFKLLNLDESSDLILNELKDRLFREGQTVFSDNHDKRIFQYKVIKDLNRNPVMILKVEQVKEIYQEGIRTVQIFMISIIVIGLILIGAIIFVLNYFVTGKIRKMSREIHDNGLKSNLGLRLTVFKSNDEITALASEFNQILASMDNLNLKIVDEQLKSDALLRNMMPDFIVQKLKSHQEVIADKYPDVTVLFADIVGFTQLSANIPPEELVGILNEIFSQFDAITEMLHLEKIKTIGDAYMLASGIPEEEPDHARLAVKAGLMMLDTMKEFRQIRKLDIHIRIGINTGPVVAGVIGITKFSYDLWGDTVNVASRIEEAGVIDHILISETSYEKVKNDYQFVEKRIDLKGKGNIRSYLLTPPHS